MPRKKQMKYQAILKSPFFIETELYTREPQFLNLEDIFGNSNPVTLELGAGYGEYAVGLARKFPDRNFIAIDIKSDRLYMGAQECEQEGLNNVRFIRLDIGQVDCVFSPESIDEIWLTFSDPQPNKPRKRLTHPIFLEKYYKILKTGGNVHIKTDSDLLFDSTLEYVPEYNNNNPNQQFDLVESTRNPGVDLTHGITTRYEKKFGDLGFSAKFAILSKV